MLKKTIVLILAACILFCTASFAETTPEGKQAPADKIVYENEYLTVRMGSIAVEEDSVTVPLSFDATGKRTCVVVSDITEEMLTNMDSIEALRKIRQIQGEMPCQMPPPVKQLNAALPGIPPDPMTALSSWISLKK